MATPAAAPPAAVSRGPAPERPLVVYDGECRFCLSQIDRLRRRDVDGVFEFVPRATPGLDERFPQIGAGDFDSGMRLVHRDGTVSVGADAVYHIARRVRGFRALAWLYRVPGLQLLLRTAYAWIARNRHRLQERCESGACGRERS